MYAIGRLEEKPGVWRWTVNITRRGKSYVKSLHDRKRGGSKKALAAAIAWRNRQFARVKTLTHLESIAKVRLAVGAVNADTPNNTSLEVSRSRSRAGTEGAGH